MRAFDVCCVVSLSLLGQAVCLGSDFALDVDGLPAVLGDKMDDGVCGDGNQFDIEFAVAEPRASGDIFVWTQVVEHVNLLGGVLDGLDGFDEFLALESLHGFRDGGLVDVCALLDRLCPGAVGAAVFDLIVYHAFVIVQGDNPGSTQSASSLDLPVAPTHFVASSLVRSA